MGRGVVEAMSGTRAGGEVEGFMDISEDHEVNGMFVEFPSGNQMDCTTKAVCLVSLSPVEPLDCQARAGR